MPAPEIDSDAFAHSRRADREVAAEARRAAVLSASAALQDARRRFVAHTVDSYAAGAPAALSDCERLEDIADRIVTSIHQLEPAFDRLDVSRDLGVHRSLVIRRARSRYDPSRLSDLIAEALAEELLSAEAAAVLAAAVRVRAL